MRLACLFLATIGCSGQLTGGHGSGDVDGGGAAADARPGTPDASPGTPDARPGTPDAAPPLPGACKRGVAYNREDGADAPALKQGIGWWYNWSPSPGDGTDALLNAGLEFVPMVFTGPPRANIDVNAIVAGIPAGSKYLLGFNEPNFKVQANLTPEQAAAAWPQVEQIADARGLKIVAPAVNFCGPAANCNGTDPIAWLDAFFAACSGCRVDYVALHWYACDKPALQFILDQYRKYHKPMWLTEFACLDAADTGVSVQTSYMKDAVPLLESDPDVFRYSWFIGRSFPGGEPDNLLGAPGTLTSLGQTYVDFAGACTP
jgi:hypothetical protein